MRATGAPLGADEPSTAAWSAANARRSVSKIGITPIVVIGRSPPMSGFSSLRM